MKLDQERLQKLYPSMEEGFAQRMERMIHSFPSQKEDENVKRFSFHMALVWALLAMLCMATACAAAFLMSVWAFVAGEYRYHDLFGGFLAMTVAPLFCLAVAPFFDPAERQKPSVHWEIAAGLLLVSICFAMRETDLFGISVSAFLAFVLTLVVTRQLGLGRGALIGLGCGLCVAPLYAPLFCIAAGISGLLWAKSATAAVT